MPRFIPFLIPYLSHQQAYPPNDFQQMGKVTHGHFGARSIDQSPCPSTPNKLPEASFWQPGPNCVMDRHVLEGKNAVSGAHSVYMYIYICIYIYTHMCVYP